MLMRHHILQIQPVSSVGMSTQIPISLVDTAMIMANIQVTTIKKFQWYDYHLELEFHCNKYVLMYCWFKTVHNREILTK
jgi:hypothetical protein